MKKKNSGQDSLGIGPPSSPPPAAAGKKSDVTNSAPVPSQELVSPGKKCPHCGIVGRATSTRERYTWYKCDGCQISYKVIKASTRFQRGMRMDGTYVEDVSKKKRKI